jgi:hypothetical protein
MHYFKPAKYLTGCSLLALLSFMATPGLAAAQVAEDTPAITDIAIENTARVAQTAVPITFGQAFVEGDLQRNEGIVGKMADGSLLPFQVNVKATHADGSVRHAILSAIVTTLATGKPVPVQLIKTEAQKQSQQPGSEAAASPDSLLADGFDAAVSITLDGKLYNASPKNALSKGRYSSWLSGAIVNEWLTSAPLLDEQGKPHPHLHVRYAIRNYAEGHGTRVDVTVENDWAYQPGPQNFTYDVKIDVGGKNVYSKLALTHYHHARWRKTFWWKDEPRVNVRENTGYLIRSKAVPNYDRTTFISELTLRDIGANWRGKKTEPMGAGEALPEMPTTGGRPDIGLIPGWGVTYLLSMDRRARDVALGTGDLAGSWSMHYRDQKTDRPISLINYPYMTILGHVSDTINPATKKSEAFPVCSDCSSPNAADSAHQPAFNYLPYLLSGDFYQLEELQFWAMWNTFKTNPGYRGNVKGLVHQSQVRDQAWSMRNIADAAYITPDSDPLKAQFVRFVENNLAWYNAQYPNNPRANKLGINVDGNIEYNGNLGIAPWMDDFFTSAIGRIAEQGFANAGPLLRYKAKFPVARMTSAGYCWIFGAAYSLNVRATPGSPLFDDLARTYASTLQSNFAEAAAAGLASLPCASPAMAAALKLKTAEMAGYSENPTGFPSNMQPALAYSVDAGVADATTAWSIFMKRSVKPQYGLGPQFAIVPR